MRVFGKITELAAILWQSNGSKNVKKAIAPFIHIRGNQQDSSVGLYAKMTSGVSAKLGTISD